MPDDYGEIEPPRTVDVTPVPAGSLDAMRLSGGPSPQFREAIDRARARRTSDVTVVTPEGLRQMEAPEEPTPKLHRMAGEWRDRNA